MRFTLVCGYDVGQHSYIYIYIYFMIAVPNKITKVDPGRVSAGYCLVNTTAPGMWTIKLPPDFCKAWVFLW